MVNTSIGSAGLNFFRISAGTAAGSAGNGIHLDGTGLAAGNGGLTVSGISFAGSGGTIQNKTGANGSTTSGIGIYLNNTKSPSFNWMQLNDFQNFGIRASGVNGFSLANSTINATGAATNGNNQGEGGIGEGSIRFENVVGTVSITDSTITHGVYDNVGVFNTNTATTLNFTASNTTFATSTNLSTGNDALRFEIEDSVAGAPQTAANIVINNDCDFTASRGDLIDVIAQLSAVSPANAAIVDTDVIGNDFSNNHSAIASGGGGVIFHGQGNHTIFVQDNDFNGARGRAVNINKGANAGTVRATLNNNRIGLTGINASGSIESAGIYVDGGGTTSMTVAITNNTIRQTNEAGIYIVANNNAGAGSSATLNATITGNTTAEPAAANFQFAGVWADIGTGVGGDTSTACLDIGGAGGLQNDFSTGDPFNFGDINLSVQTGSTIRLPGYGGANNNDAQITTYLTGRNLNPGTTTVALSHTGTIATNAGACLQP